MEDNLDFTNECVRGESELLSRIIVFFSCRVFARGGELLLRISLILQMSAQEVNANSCSG